MNEVVIVSAARTAIGRSPKGTLRHTRPDDLAAVVIRAALDRAVGLTVADVDDVVMGCATPEMEQGFDLARVALLRAGLPVGVPGVTLNRFCASGLEAIAVAAARIASGQADTIIAGGAESLSLVPFMGDTTRPNPYLMDHAPDTYLNMGLSTEQLAKKYGITREASDELALGSHQRAVAARDAGKFDEEIVPVTAWFKESDTQPAGEIVFHRDEGPRPESTLDALARLKPAFRDDGIITAGNASQRSDGAAAVLLTTSEIAARHGLTPLARFVDYAVAGVAPEDFGIAPAYAVPKLLKKTGVVIDDVDLIEFNEAFAAQVLSSNAVYQLPMDRVNVNGGAIALGHPLGATGARQTTTLLYEARRSHARYGMVSMCAALGMGAAALFEFPH